MHASVEAANTIAQTGGIPRARRGGRRMISSRNWKLGPRHHGAKFGGGARGERPHTLLVLVHLEITLSQSPAEQRGGLLPVPVAGADDGLRCGRNGHGALPCNLDSDKFSCNRVCTRN